MKTIKSFCLLLFVFTLAPAAMSSPTLWLVQDANGEGRAYLFGSVHYGSQSFYPLPAEVMSAFADSDALAVEIDLGLLSPQLAARALQRHGYYPNGERLDDRLRADERTLLNGVLNGLGEPEQPYQRMRPWLVAMQLTALQIRQSGFSKDLGLDNYFLQMARSSSSPKQVIELESLEQQLSLFGQMSEQQQLVFLRQSLAEYRNTEGALIGLTEAWRRGDEISLEQQMLSSLTGETKPLEEFLYTRRNKRMAQRLSEYLESGRSLFVVVGAGHLLGETGLKELLAERGYLLRRVDGHKALHSSSGRVEPRS